MWVYVFVLSCVCKYKVLSYIRQGVKLGWGLTCDDSCNAACEIAKTWIRDIFDE